MVAMTESVKLGIPGLSVHPGTHLCGFFRGRGEPDDMMFPFLREGLRSGDLYYVPPDGLTASQP